MQTYNAIRDLPSYLTGRQVRYDSIIDRNFYANRMALKRKTIYWLTQLTGWFLIGFINVIIISSVEGHYPENIVVWLIVCTFGVISTHLYRAFIKKNKWLELQLRKTIFRIILSSLIIGVGLFCIYLIVNSTVKASIPEASYTTLTAAINLSGSILFWSLIYFLIHYIENYRKAEIESYIWEAAVKDFELKTLKSQLNPHFMFNALNSIRALIEEDPENAKIAVTRLSNILRYSLKIEKTETVKLEEEMKTVADYLSLEKIRYEERLKYEISNSKDSLSVEIPPMMIQTLVENAIKHGISQQTKGGEITISTFVTNPTDGQAGSNLYIKITNTGQIERNSLKNAKGFGIDNTKQRLSLLYGEKALFTIKNLDSDRVSAEVIIPIGELKNESYYNR